jgi:PAS domain S-box-containing protein
MFFIKKIPGSILLKFTGAIFGLLAIFFTLFLWNIRTTEYNLLQAIHQRRKSYIELEIKETAKRIFEKRLTLIKTTVGKYKGELSSALFTVNRGKCLEIISNLAVFPCIQGVILYDSLVNSPFITAQKLQDAKFSFKTQQTLHFDNLSSLLVNLQDKHGKKLGYLKIYYDTLLLTEEIRKLKQEDLAALNRETEFARDILHDSLKQQLVSLFLMFAALYITLYVLFTRIIYKPIRQLEHNLKLFFKTLTGENEQAISLEEINANDEFGRMGTFINNGITVSIKIHRELAQHTRELSKLATVLEQSAQSILITDLQGRIEYVNPAFEKITGYTFAEVKGKKPKIMKSGNHPKSFYQELWATILAGRSWTGVFANRKKNGTIYYERSIIFPVKDRTGTIINFAAAKQDITKERDLEHQLRQTQKMESIGLLAGGIAHDFNNLLTVINGYAEMAIQSTDPGNPLRNDFKAILNAGQRAQHLTSQLLAFSHKQSFTPQIIDLNQTLTAMEKMMRRLIGEDIKIRTCLAEKLPKIKADTSQVEQIFINLIINARDALNATGKTDLQKEITIKTNTAPPNPDTLSSARSAKLNGHYIYFSVSDNGIGMDEATQQRIFEPFFTTKEKHRGTGLGLAIIYGIVKQNNGMIQVQSNPDQGTTFTIYWPVAEGQEMADNERPPHGTLQGHETILLVEDEESVRQFTKKTLASLGYTVYTAENGRAALKLLHEGFEAHLIITDVIMPEMNGWDFANKARKIFPDQKIIFLSGYTDDRLPKIEKTGNGFEFINKPFSIRKLATIVRKLLDTS